MKSCTLFVLLFLVSCGKNTSKTVYIENPYDNSANDERFTDIENRISSLEDLVETNILAIEYTNLKIEAVESLQADLNQSQSDELIRLNGNLERLQGATDNFIAQLAQLKAQDNVVVMIDPCPSVKSKDYKEMLFKLESGALVAYFEDGGKRFLTVLTPGNYRTTDSRQCNFTVDNNNVIR